MSSNFEEMFSQAHEDLGGAEPDHQVSNVDEAQDDIGRYLRNLRGGLSLRQLQEETGIAYSYLSDIERGSKRPGERVLSRLAIHHGVPLDDLLDMAGVQRKEQPQTHLSATDIRRSFRFVMDDPGLVSYQKPADDLPIDAQRFVVQMYEHFTGKRLLA